MPSLNTGNAILSNAIAVNSSYNVGIGGAASGSFKLQVTGNVNADNFIIQPTGYGLLASLSRDLTGSGFGVLNLKNGSNGFIQPAALSVDRTYTLPDATGTIALTSNLSAYLPLAGGTLTGALSGTSATFSTEVTSSGSQGRFGGWATGAGYQGNALEVGVSGGTATLLGYNRTSGAYIPLLIGGNTNQTTTIGGNTIVLQNNGTTALTIASTAATFATRVRIGSFTSIENSGGVDTNLSNNATFDGTNWKYIASQEAARYLMNRNTHQFFIAPAGIAGNNITFTQAMTITSGGLVRIGPVTDTDGTLQVRGWSQSTYAPTGYNGTGANLRLLPSSTGGTNIATGISFGIGGAAEAYIGAVQQSNNFADIVFQIYNGSGYGERMRITSDGRVLIRVTSNPAGGALAVASNGVVVYDGANYRQMYQSGSAMYWFNGTNEAYLSSAGVWTNASDISIKKDINDIKYGLNEVMKLKPKSYKMIDDDLEQIGFIAQDVEELLPELVSTSGKGMKGLSYGNLTAVLTKAIQEQQKQIEELKAMIAAK